jgi:nitrite reductase/ring-hydroxylating ferredoxin subunit
LTDALYPYKIRQVIDADRDVRDLIPEIFAPNIEFCTARPRLFYLEPLFHKRSVTSFDVELGEGVKEFQIGSAELHELRQATDSSSSQPPGLVNMRSAWAFDLRACPTHGCAIGEDLPAGRVIRCDLRERHFQVDNGEPFRNSMPENRIRRGPPNPVTPVIWGVGLWKITKIEMEVSDANSKNNYYYSALST